MCVYICKYLQIYLINVLYWPKFFSHCDKQKTAYSILKIIEYIYSVCVFKQIITIFQFRVVVLKLSMHVVINCSLSTPILIIAK